MRSAIVADGIVTNVIIGEITGSVPCDEKVGIGWSWDGATFAAPPAPEPEPEPEPAPTAQQVRAHRNALLAATDWMALSDVTMSPEWAAYRQALRDVPNQVGFPDNVTWPIAPE